MKIIDLKNSKENMEHTHFFPRSRSEKIEEENFFEWTFKEKFNLKKNWQTGIIIFLILSLVYFLWNKNYFGSVLILIIFLIFFLPKKEKETYFAILKEGVRREEEIFPYRNLESFWIFEEPAELYLKTKSSYIPYVILPLNKENIGVIKEILLQFLPEKEAERNIIDVISRIIGI